MKVAYTMRTTYQKRGASDGSIAVERFRRNLGCH